MCQYSADNGNPSKWHYGHFQQLAFSGAGMIMIESTAVSSQGRITLKDLTLKDKKNENSFRKLVTYIKGLNKIPIGIQISHSGRKGSAHIPWKQYNSSLKQNENSWETVAPSPLKRDQNWPKPKTLTQEKISNIKDDFRNAAFRANRIGFDCVEIHMGHGYLLHQFFSPISNRRKDDYGGSLENRSKFILEVLTEVRNIWPINKILGVRLTGDDWLDDGITIEDTLWLVKRLQDIGLDYVCVTSGGILPKTKLNFKKGYQVHLASIIKNKTGIITRTSGLIENINHANQILDDKCADLIAFGRRFINQPTWLIHEILKRNKSIALPDQYLRCF